jgi:hypothetical protein
LPELELGIAPGALPDDIGEGRPGLQVTGQSVLEAPPPRANRADQSERSRPVRGDDARSLAGFWLWSPWRPAEELLSVLR